MSDDELMSKRLEPGKSGADRITLDRTNLLRYLDVAEKTFRNEPRLHTGTLDVVFGTMRDLAVCMPHLYGNDGCPVLLPIKEDP